MEAGLAGVAAEAEGASGVDAAAPSRGLAAPADGGGCEAGPGGGCTGDGKIRGLMPSASSSPSPDMRGK